MEGSNAVIYARYSSYGQTEQSIEGQLRDCYAYAEREGLTVIEEYIDRAISGRTDNRPALQRMIEDSDKKQFKYVIVWKLDRFSRDRYDSAIYKSKLKKNGVKVLSAMENIGDGDESIILEAVLEAFSEHFSRDLSKKVKRGQRETALKGGFIGGFVPFGYKVIDKQIVIDEERAPHIQWAFQQYANGTPKKEIMRVLSEKGVTGTHGGALSLSSFQHALKNQKYTGCYMFKDIEMNNYPMLIEPELFERVQKRLAQNAHAPAASKAHVAYLLQGKAYCGMCGTRLVGESGRGKGGQNFYYYACGQRKKLHTCTKRNEKKDFIEWYVVEQTVEYVLDPTRIDIIAKAVVAEYDKEFNDDAVKDLERRIAKLDREIQTAVNLLISSGNKTLIAPTEKRVEELTVQKEDAEIDLSKLRIANSVRLTVEEIKLWLRQFCKGDLFDMDFRRRIIDVFVNSIYLYDDKTVIFYNIKGGKQVSHIGVAEAVEGEPDGWESCAGDAGGSVRISPQTACQNGFLI